MSSYWNLRLFTTDCGILASKIHNNTKKIFCSQSKHLNKKSLWFSIFISFNMGWVSQSTNFAVILQLSYSSLTLSFCLSLHICNCQSISVSKTDGSSSRRSRCHASLSCFFPLHSMRFSLSVHLSPLSVSLSDCATQSYLDAEHLRSKPFDVSSVSSSKKMQQMWKYLNTECNKLSTFVTLKK